MVLERPKLSDPLDFQPLRFRIAENIDEIFDHCPTNANRLVARQVGENFHYHFTRTGGISKEQLLDISKRCDYRWLESLGTLMDERPWKVETKQGPTGAYLSSDSPNLLVYNLVDKGKATIDKSHGENCANLLLNDSRGGFSNYNRLTADEKREALQAMGFQSHNIAAAIQRMDMTIDLQEYVFAASRDMHSKVFTLSGMRQAKEIPDDKSHEFWTPRRLSKFDPTRFWNEERKKRLDVSPFMAMRQDVADDWGNLDHKEREIYTKFLSVMAYGVATKLWDIVANVSDLSRETGGLSRIQIPLQGMNTAHDEVDPNGNRFTRQLKTLRSRNTEYLRMVDYNKQWGISEDQIQLLDDAIRVVEDRPACIQPYKEDPKIIRQMRDRRPTLIKDGRKEPTYFRHLNGFINDVIYVHKRNPKAAQLMWNCIRPEGIEPENAPLWPTRFWVSSQIDRSDTLNPSVDYPGIVRPLIRANAKKPYIDSYVLGLSQQLPPDDYALLDSYLSQDYFDNHLDRMTLVTAQMVCMEFKRDQAKPYLVPVREEGRQVLEAIKQERLLMVPVGASYSVNEEDEMVVEYLKCLADPVSRTCLQQTCSQPYFGFYARTYTFGDSELRGELRSDDFLDLLAVSEQGFGKSASVYLDTINRSQDKDVLISPAVKQIIRRDPMVIASLDDLQEAGRLGELGPYLSNEQNIGFFDRSKLDEFCEKSGDPGQWPIALAALSHLE